MQRRLFDLPKLIPSLTRLLDIVPKMAPISKDRILISDKHHIGLHNIHYLQLISYAMIEKM